MQSVDFSLDIRFIPMIDIGFWTTLSRKKLDEYKLDTSAKPVFAKYKLNNFKDKNQTSSLFFDIYSFSAESIECRNCSGPVEIVLPGNLYVLNTVEEFKNFDKEKEIRRLFKMNLEKLDAKNKFVFEKNFSLVVFADLKSHLFHYFFLFPDIVCNGIETQEISVFHEKHKELAPELEKALRAHILETMKEKNEFLFFTLRDQKENTFKFLTFSEFLEHYKTNPEKNGLWLIFVDSYNQGSGTNALMKMTLSGISKFVGAGKFNFVIIKDFFYYNPTKCLEFRNSIFWQKIDEEAVVVNPKAITEAKCLDLKSFIDETSLAENAVNLNIKLMKWRLCPELDIDIMQKTRVLCFGAGTLGCQLSRNLIGWGVRNITFVDYGKVSYSNPVRQSLFNFEDSTKGGKPKAEAAAESLRKIFPSINSKGVQLEIPMPGHFISSPEQAKKVLENLEMIEKLVEEHDALFLLTDTRESRWLPTVLANKYNKMCISVALGFDSYVIIRHGISPKHHNQEKHGDRLACYFCNDILTPNNSLIDRTLDQQCTVTRPGGSFLASAYASELFISLLHHPLKHGASSAEENNDMSSTPLGILPQHIRGNISDFEIMKLYGRAFENCIACSEYVLDEYLKNRDEFILKVINTPDFLQDVTKITETLNAMDLENAIICLDEESDKENNKS